MKRLLTTGMISVLAACGPSTTSPEITQSPSVLPSAACGRVATFEFLDKGGDAEINARVRPTGTENCVYGDSVDGRAVPVSAGLILVICIDRDTNELFVKETAVGSGPFFLAPDSQTNVPENLPPCTDAHYQ